jgi:hypothetical protein
MAPYIWFIAVIVGLLLYLPKSNAKAQDIGRMLLFAAILALLIATTPSTVARFFH